ncbi:exodeoxyribonuclease VII large subunit [Rhodomicrobium lacus]|uniref:exodeoxyribonuclease VII large subunit n=1 Tax=Rhodomicrobium lacus TaxID=2498452 RepID=UPI0026E3DD00|nr:exodeoxyribonuclease VII large subunit [Rhodomicrobium lacus]WKW49684.1 exodeoxyribonuclease VII large subunit [Rhodomicrobium lacus]
MLSPMQAELLSNIAEFTVSELSFAIKRTVEDAYGLVRLRGEISGYRGQHSSGHAYLCLKDDKARIDAVIWRGTFNHLKFKPEEGLEVIVTGRVTTFPGKSSYQIVIEQLEPAGAGALMALLEERKKKLAAEGLFDEDRKRPLPFWPQVVGIVTSPTGAVIRDMLHGFTERCPTRVIVWPVRVQGETCGAEVSAAIRGFNALDGFGPLPRPDLLIVARGGGSLEDLWGFNEEAVVRAAAESAIPLISAVGHETDWTLIDLVADARAPTPTKAAEWAVPKHADLILRLAECIERTRRCVRRNLEQLRAEFRSAERGLPRPHTLLQVPRQRLDTAGARLGQALIYFTERSRGRFERSAVRLSPRLVARPVVEARERLGRAATFNARAFRDVIVRKRERWTVRAERLNAGLLATPTQRGIERLLGLAARADQAVTNLAQRYRQRVAALGQLLQSLGHKSVLERGFALVRGADGRVIRRAASVPGAAALDIEFADGHVRAHGAAADARAEPAATRRRPATQPQPSRRATSRDKDGQGTLL